MTGNGWVEATSAQLSRRVVEILFMGATWCNHFEAEVLVTGLNYFLKKL